MSPAALMARPRAVVAPSQAPMSVMVTPFHEKACSAAVGVDVPPVTQPFALIADAVLLPPPSDPKSVKTPAFQTNARVKALYEGAPSCRGDVPATRPESLMPAAVIV